MASLPVSVQSSALPFIRSLSTCPYRFVHLLPVFVFGFHTHLITLSDTDMDWDDTPTTPRFSTSLVQPDHQPASLLVRDRAARLRNAEAILDKHTGPSSRSLAVLENDPGSFLNLFKTVSKKVDENARDMKREMDRIRAQESVSRRNSEEHQRKTASTSRLRKGQENLRRSSTDALPLVRAKRTPLARVASSPDCEMDISTSVQTSTQTMNDSRHGSSELSLPAVPSRHMSKNSCYSAVADRNAAYAAIDGADKRPKMTPVCSVQTPITPPSDTPQTFVDEPKLGSQKKSSQSRASHPPPLGMRRNSYSKPPMFQPGQTHSTKYKPFRSPLLHPPGSQSLGPSERRADVWEQKHDPSLYLTRNTLPTPDSTPSRESGPRTSSQTISIECQENLPADGSASPPAGADSSFGDISFGIDEDTLEQEMRKYDAMVLT